MSTSMRKSILIYLVITGLLTFCLVGCGSEKPSAFQSERYISQFEKNMNSLNVGYLMDHIYCEPFQTENEAVITVAFMGELLFEGAGNAAEAVGKIIMRLLEKEKLLTRKDLLKAATDWKKDILKNFKYEIVNYSVLEERSTGGVEAALVEIEHQIQIGNVLYFGSAKLEFLRQKNQWKFRMITG